MLIDRTVTVARPIAEVFAYLSDFSTTTQWDPGSVATARISGDGGVGTRYANTSVFNGRETQLEYVVVAYEQDRRIQLRGENKTVIALDTMTFTEVDGGTRINYTADFTFKGITKVAEPFLKGAFQKLGDEAAEGLARVFA